MKFPTLIERCTELVTNAQPWTIEMNISSHFTYDLPEGKSGCTGGERSGVKRQQLKLLLEKYNLISLLPFDNNDLIYNLVPTTPEEWLRLDEMFDGTKFCFSYYCEVPEEIRVPDKFNGILTKIQLKPSGSTVRDKGGLGRITPKVLPSLAVASGIPDLKYRSEDIEDAVQAAAFSEYKKNYRKYGPSWG